MPYAQLNIGQLLFLLPNAELKQRVRNLERFYKCYISAKTGILLNKTCLNEGSSQTIQYIYILTYRTLTMKLCIVTCSLLHIFVIACILKCVM